MLLIAQHSIIFTVELYRITLNTIILTSIGVRAAVCIHVLRHVISAVALQGQITVIEVRASNIDRLLELHRQ